MQNNVLLHRYVKIVQTFSVFPVGNVASKVYKDKTVRFLPRFFAEISDFIFWHIVTYVVVVDVIYVFPVLFKQNNEICIFSNRLSGKYEIILT